MELFIEKKSDGWNKHPTMFRIVHETKKSVTMQPLHSSAKAEKVKVEDFNARFKAVWNKTLDLTYIWAHKRKEIDMSLKKDYKHIDDGVVGWKCACCNPYNVHPRNMKHLVRRRVRRTTKHDMRNIMNDDWL